MQQRGWTERAQVRVQAFIDLLKAQETPVFSPFIERALGINGEEVRAIRHYLNCQGELVCSTPDKGYWWARSVEDLIETKEQIRGRRKSLEEVERGIDLAIVHFRMGAVQGRML